MSSLYSTLENPSEMTIAVVALLIGVGFMLVRRVY